MNKVSFVIIMVGLLLGALALRGANASNSSMALNGSSLDISMSLDLSTACPSSNQAEIIIPALVNGNDPDETDDLYFKVAVNVLPWVVRINNISF